MEEAAIVALRVQARLPLDERLHRPEECHPASGPLQLASLPSTAQHSPPAETGPRKPKQFKKHEIGYFHIDIAELRYEGGKGFLSVAVDRASYTKSLKP